MSDVPERARFEEATGESALYDVSHLLPTHRHERYRRRHVDGIDLLVVHHSGRLSKHHQAYDGMRNSARFVVTQRKNRDGTSGWPGFPYHAWIPYGEVLDDAGRRVWFRGQQDNVRSWHTGGLNKRGWSICLQGALSKHPPSDHQLAVLADAVPWAVARFGLCEDHIVGHCEADRYGGHRKDACPGTHAMSWIGGLRTSAVG